MDSNLDARVEPSRQPAVEERRAGEDQEEDAAWETGVEDGWFDDWFNRRDFVMLMISVVILAFGIWWVTPW